METIIKIKGVDTKVTVIELSLIQIKKLLSDLNNLSPEVKAKFSKIDKMDNDKILAIVLEHIEDLGGIIAMCVDEDFVTAEVVTKLGINSLLGLVVAIMEVNDIEGIIEKVKKIVALYQKVVPAKPKLPDATPVPQEQTPTTG